MPPFRCPDDHAIVVGIDHYCDEIKALQGARNDAIFFREWLEAADGGGLDPANITMILSEHKDGVRSPNRDDVEDALLKHIVAYRNTGTKKNRLYLYLSGHGATPADGRDDCLLLMANAVQGALRNIPVETTGNIFWQGAIFREVVLFADCCRAPTSSLARIPLSFMELAEEIIRDAEGETASMICGLATRWSRLAREQDLPDPRRENWVPRGRFTYALLDGLKRAADEDGNITAKTLEAYVTTIVHQLGGAHDDQTPQIRIEGDLVLLSGVNGKTRVLVALSEPVDRIAVRDGMDIMREVPAEQKKIEPRLLELHLTPGLYFLAIPKDGGGFTSGQPVTVADEVIRVEL